MKDEPSTSACISIYSMFNIIQNQPGISPEKTQKHKYNIILFLDNKVNIMQLRHDTVLVAHLFEQKGMNDTTTKPIAQLRHNF